MRRFSRRFRSHGALPVFSHAGDTQIDTTAAAVAETAARNKWLALIAACFGLAMLYVDLFIVNVALPTIARDLQASLAVVSWAVTGYVLMIGVLPMGFGRLGDIWGQKRVYLAGLIIFTLASLACGLAPSISVLIAFRVVQGIGAAILTPSTLAIVTRAFPVSERGLALGIYGGVSGLGLVAGPVLGGLLVFGSQWRGVFFINVPVGLIAILLALRFVREFRDPDVTPSVDWAGLTLLSSGLFCVLYAITQAGSAGSDGLLTPSVAGGAVIGCGLLALFVRAERRARQPLIDLAIFRNAPFVLACVSFFLYSAALFGSQPYWSLFMQNGWGLTPLQGGLAYLPATGLIALLTPLSGVVSQWAGTRLRFVTTAGALAIAASFVYVAATISPTSTYASALLPAFLARGIGIPIFSTCAMLAVMNALPLSQAGLASGTLGMARNIGTALGIALLGGVYVQAVDSVLPSHLGALPPAQARQMTGAAQQFLAGGTGTIHQAVALVVLHGFVVLSVAGAVCCCLSALAALFIRERRDATHSATRKARVASGWLTKRRASAA